MNIFLKINNSVLRMPSLSIDILDCIFQYFEQVSFKSVWRSVHIFFIFFCNESILGLNSIKICKIGVLDGGKKPVNYNPFIFWVCMIDLIYLPLSLPCL